MSRPETSLMSVWMALRTRSWVSIAALGLSTASCLLIVFDPEQRGGLAITAVFLVVCYVGYWVANRRISL